MRMACFLYQSFNCILTVCLSDLSGVKTVKNFPAIFTSFFLDLKNFNLYCFPKYKCVSPETYSRCGVCGRNSAKNSCCLTIHRALFSILRFMISGLDVCGAVTVTERSGLSFIPSVFRAEYCSL